MKVLVNKYHYNTLIEYRNLYYFILEILNEHFEIHMQISDYLTTYSKKWTITLDKLKQINKNKFSSMDSARIKSPPCVMHDNNDRVKSIKVSEKVINELKKDKIKYKQSLELLIESENQLLEYKDFIKNDLVESYLELIHHKYDINRFLELQNEGDHYLFWRI